jgi:predicted RNase H-like HicB family nuclease
MSMTRHVIVHPAEEGGYWVEVPSLPGCYSQGETKEEALENIKEAIAVHVEDMIATGEEVPEDLPFSVETVSMYWPGCLCFRPESVLPLSKRPAFR